MMRLPLARRARKPRSRATVVALLAAILGIVPLAAHASAPAPDPRWLPWIGCWMPTGATEDAAPSVTGVQRVCVMPAQDSEGVDVVNIANGQIVNRVRIDANGERRPVSREGCTGWESARWSSGAERVFLRSELTCSGNITRTSSGIIAVASPSDWVDVEVVTVGDQRSTRILRYRSVADTTALAREISAAIRDREMARQAARLAAASSPTIDDVVEASREADPAVVEAWLLQRMPRFAIDGAGLTRLADARVPDSVIDLVVALATPERFSDRLSARGYTFIRIDSPRPVAVGAADPVPVPADQYYDAPETTIAIQGAGHDEEPAGHRRYDDCCQYGVTYYNAYPITPFGFYPYWPYTGYHYDRYSTGYGYYPYTPFDPYRPRPIRPTQSRGQTQVITLPQRRPVKSAPAPQPDPAPEPAGGRVVNGRGYTRPADADATNRAPVTRSVEPAPVRQARPASEPAPTRNVRSTPEPPPTRDAPSTPAPTRKAIRSSPPAPAPAPRPAASSTSGSRGQAAPPPAKASGSGTAKASGAAQPETPARTAKRRPPPTA